LGKPALTIESNDYLQQGLKLLLIFFGAIRKE